MYIVPDTELVRETYNERVAEAQRTLGVQHQEKRDTPLTVRVARILRTSLANLRARD